MRFALFMRHVAYKIPFQPISEQALFNSQKHGPVSIIFWFYKFCDVKYEANERGGPEQVS
jgi:hypothetical protein